MERNQNAAYVQYLNVELQNWPSFISAPLKILTIYILKNTELIFCHSSAFLQKPGKKSVKRAISFICIVPSNKQWVLASFLRARNSSFGIMCLTNILKNVQIVKTCRDNVLKHTYRCNCKIYSLMGRKWRQKTKQEQHSIKKYMLYLNSSSPALSCPVNRSSKNSGCVLFDPSYQHSYTWEMSRALCMQITYSLTEQRQRKEVKHLEKLVVNMCERV